MIKYLFLSVLFLYSNIFNDLYSQSIDRAYTTTSVTVLDSEELIESNIVSELAFGNFAVTSSECEISMNASGDLESSGVFLNQSGAYSPAIFTLSENNSYAIHIDTPNDTVVLSNSEGSEEIIITGWEANYLSENDSSPSVSEQGVSLGATLSLLNTERNLQGRYEGEYVVTFAYN